MANAWHCDERGCDTWSRSPYTVGFLKISPARGMELHFCCWDCVLKYAATKTPLEVMSNDH